MSGLLRDPLVLLCKNKAPAFAKPFFVNHWINPFVFAIILAGVYFAKPKWFNSMDGKTKSVPVSIAAALVAHFYLMWPVMVFGGLFCFASK